MIQTNCIRNNTISTTTTPVRTTPDNIIHSGKPSPSALFVARHRAAHQLIDTPPIFNDPLALRLLGAEMEAEVRQEALSLKTRHSSLNSVPCSVPYSAPFSTPYSTLLRTAFAVRSRVAEDQLALAVAAGVTQYVVLGAGLDTFAYRNTNPALRLFEVDHPATQTWKHALLASSNIRIPPELTFIPADLNQAALLKTLASAGCRIDLPIFFSWLGVTLYLHHTTIFSTLKAIASLPKNSTIVFDYGVKTAFLPPMEQLGIAHMSKFQAAQGEPFTDFFDPDELLRCCQQLGYTRIEDKGAYELTRQYLSGRQDSLALAGATRLLIAGV